MKKTILIFALFVLQRAVIAQESVETGYASQISPVELKEYLSIIASDAMEGRKTGTRGQKMAAAFIANHFQEIGLTPPVNGSYYQTFDLYSTAVSSVTLSAGSLRYDNLGEMFYFGTSDSGGDVALDVVFVGRASEEELTKVDVKGKAAVILVGKLTGLRAARKLVKAVQDKGAKIVFVMSESTSDEFHAFVSQIKGYLSGGTYTLQKPDAASTNKGMFVINQVVAEKIFNTTYAKLLKAADDPKKTLITKVKPGKATYNVAAKSIPVKTENVLGYLEGSDKKDEVVLVTAHYDHIGVGGDGEDKINNGADDDGSGTVSVLELAKIFAKAKKEGHGPRRSMVFMTVVGEELGLFGSEYYVQNPVYPLANTVVDLNIDMVGRVDPGHKEKPEYVYVIGSNRISTELHNINEKANADHTKLVLDYVYNDENHPENFYQRSDHWNFAKNGIPIIFYFNGVHEDYHKQGDEVSKINFEILAKRDQLVFYTAWEIANKEARIVSDKK